MGYFLSSCKCTYLRDNRTVFLSSYFTLEEIPFLSERFSKSIVDRKSI